MASELTWDSSRVFANFNNFRTFSEKNNRNVRETDNLRGNGCKPKIAKNM